MRDYLTKAFKIVAKRKTDADRLVNAFRQRLRQDSVYLQLEEERDGLLFERARLVSQNMDLGNLNQQIEQLDSNLDKRIKALGYDKEGLEPKYVCGVCKDTGMVRGENCSCVKRLVTRLLQEDAGELITEEKDFKKSFSSLRQDEGSLAAYRSLYSYLHDYTKSFPRVEHKIVGVLGAAGTGKSYALAVAANILVDEGYSVYFVNAQQMNNIFLKYHLASIENKEDVFSQLVQPDLLIIDDLGTEAILNNVTLEYLYSLLAQRNRRFTMFTTNLSIKTLEDRYGQRIISRLADKTLTKHFLLSGKDLRLI